MNIAPSAAREKEQENREKSPVFLAVFTVFSAATAIYVVFACIAVLMGRPAQHDTLWFWACGHLLVHHANPYSRETMRQIEIAMGVPLQGRDVLMVLNPPYSLFLFLPLGILAAKEAVIAWSLILAAFLILSVRAVQAMADARYERGYLLLAYFFVPAICCIEVGQTGLITLLGLAMFLRFHEDAPGWAGAALTLCAVKPHLLLPFGAVLLVWIVARRRWAVAGRAVLALAVESLIAMAFDHRIWTQYRAMMHSEPFVDKPIATLGVALRFALDKNALWLEFVPAVVGVAWALWYFRRNQEQWNWTTHGSVVTLVSLVVAPYSWVTDQVIVLPAILFVLLGARSPRKGSVTLLMVIMSAKEIQMLVTRSFLSKWDVVLAIAWLAWYLYATSQKSSDRVGERIHLPAATPAAN